MRTECSQLPALCASPWMLLSYHSVEGRRCYQQQVSWLGSSLVAQLVLGCDRQQLLQWRLQCPVRLHQHGAQLLETRTGGGMGERSRPKECSDVWYWLSLILNTNIILLLSNIYAVMKWTNFGKSVLLCLPGYIGKDRYINFKNLKRNILNLPVQTEPLQWISTVPSLSHWTVSAENTTAQTRQQSTSWQNRRDMAECSYRSSRDTDCLDWTLWLSQNLSEEFNVCGWEKFTEVQELQRPVVKETERKI